MAARTLPLPARWALALILAPTAWFAWTWREMPQLGGNPDELMYYIGGKSLADGKGYRIVSFPGEPFQTKYPPGLPAVSALAWMAGGRYPDNLPYHTLACWLFLAASAFGFRRWAVEAGLPEAVALGLAALWALNPYAFQFGTTLLSELPFTAILLGCLLCLHRNGARWALAAGLLAAAGILMRTIGLLLLPPAAVWLWRNGRRRDIPWFLSLPALTAAGWFAWTAAHKTPGLSPVGLYYLDYLGYHVRHFLWDEPWLAVWKNLDGILLGLGAFVFPQTEGMLMDKILAQVVAVGGLAGVVRMARRDPSGPAALYAGFAALLIVVMAVWHFPANERLILPAAPLVLAGLAVEAQFLAAGLRRSWTSAKTGDRTAAAVLAVLLGCGAVYALRAQWATTTELLPETNSRAARQLAETEPMMRWIRQHLPADAAVVAEYDALFHLRSGGRHAAAIFTSPQLWYREQYDEQVRQYAAIERFAIENRLGYLYLAGGDYERRMPAEYHSRVHELWKQNPSLVEVHRAERGVIYRIEAGLGAGQK